MEDSAKPFVWGNWSFGALVNGARSAEGGQGVNIMDAGLLGGIVGGALGVAGGAVGTYCSIRNTNGPLERAFMVRMAVTAWVAVTLFLVLLVALPRPYNYLMWIPYGFLLPIGIIKANRVQAELRKREGGT
jgi:hypothetical protein